MSSRYLLKELLWLLFTCLWHEKLIDYLGHLGFLERVLVGRHLVLLEVSFVSTHFIINMEATWQPVPQGL